MKYTKIIILLFLLATFASSYSQEYWLKQNSPTTNNLRRCFFLDSLTGWVVGDSGTIIHTSNKGSSWSVQESNIRSFFTSVYFINKRIGWGLAWSLYTDTNFYGTIVLKTTNGGLNWDSTRYPVSNVYLKCIYFIDSLVGFMGGSPANIIKTTDGGNTWNYCQLDSNIFSQFPVNNFVFLNYSYGFAYGGVMDMGGVLWRTTNGGQHWTSAVVTSEPIYKMILYDSLNLFGVGGDFEFGPSTIRSYNAGANWNYRMLGYIGVANSLSFRTQTEGWSSLGGIQKLIYTLDTGKSWTDIPSPDSSIINDLTFTDKRNGFAIGDNGVIYKFNTALVGILENQNTLIPVETKLFQNYPNPFNPVTTIRYSINHNSTVILKIYDLSGREIRSVNIGEQNAGIYDYSFHAENLASGVYFYRLIAQTTDLKINTVKVETRKMVLLK